MGIYEKIEMLAREGQKHDTLANVSKEVLNWLDSPSNPLVPEEQELNYKNYLKECTSLSYEEWKEQGGC